VQPRPTATELLEAVAEVLEKIVPALEGNPIQHQARVAASLVGILDRELRLSPEADARELAAVQRLLPDAQGDLATLREQLSIALRSGMADSGEKSAEIWPVLMAAVKDDLAVVKPGHDGWEGD
jgi:hypothetical protein